MKLSDCPHPVGTPEHSEWVKRVYIPYAELVLSKADQPGAAEQQGRRLLHGARFNPDGTERPTTTTTPSRHSMEVLRRQMAGFSDPFVPLGRTADRARNDFQVFYEEFTNISTTTFRSCSIVILDDDIKGVSGSGHAQGGRKRRPIPKKQERECPRHGGPTASCRRCWR